LTLIEELGAAKIVGTRTRSDAPATFSASANARVLLIGDLDRGAEELGAGDISPQPRRRFRAPS